MALSQIRALAILLWASALAMATDRVALAEQGATVPQGARDLVMFEARLLPKSCEAPQLCLPQSQLILRNIAALQMGESAQIISFLNRIAAIRDVEVPWRDSLTTSVPVNRQDFHRLELSEVQDLLKDHPGVYFDSGALDSVDDTRSFGTFIRTQMQGAGVRFLTEEELETVSGRPVLSVRYGVRRESAGCIIPFSIAMTLTEEVVLARNPDLKISTKIWSRTARQNLANRNYTLESALREVVDEFLKDWNSANAK